MDVSNTRGASLRISRPALAKSLNRALDAGGAVLVAEAGFGKTMAVEEALARRSCAVAWVHVREDDRAPGRLVVHLVDAVRSALPGAADVVAERLGAGREPLDAAAALRDLLAELERLLVEEMVVVVDDAERLEDDEPALALLAELLTTGAGGRVRTVVATRRPLGMRLAKARSAGRLTEVGAAELALSPAECAELVRAATGREPASEELHELMAATEGWPLGVALCALAGTAELSAKSREAVFGFFEEEVLERLPRELREAVLDASLLDELDPAVVEQLGYDPALFERAEHLGLFLRRTGSERLAFHPLFRDFLRSRLPLERSPQDLRTLHRALARAVAGDGVAAVGHWLDAEAWEEATAALAQAGPALARTSPELLLAFLARLPPDWRGRPAPRLLEGTIALGAGRYEEAVALLEQAVEGFRAAGDVAWEWVARLALCDGMFPLKRWEAVVALADGFDDPRAAGAYAAPQVAVIASTALARLDRFEEAEEYERRAIAHPLGGFMAALMPGHHGIYIDLPAGRLDAALAATDMLISGLRASDPFNRLPYVLAFRAAILDERGEDEEALAAAREALGAAGGTGLGGFVGAIVEMHNAGQHARAGRFDEAERALARVPPAVEDAWMSYDLHVTRATLAAHGGEPAEVAAAARRATEMLADGPSYERARATALLVPVLVDVGLAELARTILGETLSALPPAVSSARLLLLRAWIGVESGALDDAMDDFAAAWRRAGAEVQHLLRREWPRAEALLWTALDRGVVDSEEAVRAIEAARPGGAALLPFARHPLPRMRRAAGLAAAAAGDPRAFDELAALEQDPEPEVAAAARAAAGRIRHDPPPLRFEVFGGFALRRGAWCVDDAAWSRRLAERLVRYLLVRANEAVPEDLLFEAFWPDKPSASARRGLQVAVSCARGVLDPPGAEGSLLEAAERSYRLALRPKDSVDAYEFERAATAALAERGAARLRLSERAVTLWTGEPLPEERYSDWAVAWRERLADLYAEALASLSDAHLDAGDAAAAVDAARRLVELDPLNESGQRRLMRAYARSGRRGHALRQFLECRRALVRELGVEPSTETAELQRRILAGEAV